METLSELLFLGALGLLVLFYLWMTIDGTIQAFQKKWYIGVAALVVPAFALILGISKKVFKKDLLENA